MTFDGSGLIRRGQLYLIRQYNLYYLQDFKIDVIPLDDGSPVLKTNLGLQFLEQSGNLVSLYLHYM